MSGQPKLSRAQILAIVERTHFMDRTFKLIDKGDGYLVQMEYFEADVEKPGSAPIRQSTRKWYLSPFMTESEIVETIWACVCRSQIHVASEHFTYEGQRVYSQHFDVRARFDLAADRRFDKRLDY